MLTMYQALYQPVQHDSSLDSHNNGKKQRSLCKGLCAGRCAYCLSFDPHNNSRERWARKTSSSPMRKGDHGHCTTWLEIKDRIQVRIANLISERLSSLPEDTQLDGGRTGLEPNLSETEPSSPVLCSFWFSHILPPSSPLSPSPGHTGTVRSKAWVLLLGNLASNSCSTTSDLVWALGPLFNLS